MTSATEELLLDVLTELLDELRARRRARDDDEDQRRVDEALARRGYAMPRRPRR